jgi:hypothetical protein
MAVLALPVVSGENTGDLYRFKIGSLTRGLMLLFDTTLPVDQFCLFFLSGVYRVARMCSKLSALCPLVSNRLYLVVLMMQGVVTSISTKDPTWNPMRINYYKAAANFFHQ